MMSNAEYRTTNHKMMDIGISAAQLHRQQATPASRGEDAPGYRRSSVNLSVDCNSNNEGNETTSTATTSSERSSRPLQQEQPPLDPSLGVESVMMHTRTVMMHTRTNFGDTQTYVPPATKTYPYSVPTGAPTTSPPKPQYAVTPPSSSRFSVRDKQQQHSKGRSLIIAEEGGNDYSYSMDQSPARNTVSSIMSTPPRTPLDAKRLQFYDSPTTAMSVGGVEGQIPFDQVWNNQEFVLGEDEDEAADPALLTTTPRNRARHNHGALPFDEAPEEQSGGASDFSIVSSTPPPPALMTPTQKARLIINARFNNKQNQNHNDFLRPSPDASYAAQRADPPEVRHFVPTTETAATTRRTLKHPVLVSPNGDEEDDDPVHQPPVEDPAIQKDDDIPSDEDETKRTRRQQQQREPKPMRDTTRDNRHLSLATASRRKTAEDVGHRMAVEDLSSHILGSSNYEYDDNEYDVHPEDSHDLNDSYNHHHHDEEEETTAGADDDSLFDFKEQLSRSQSNSSWREPGGRHAVEEEASLEDDDYYHQQHPGGVAASTSCLKTRAQEAFAYRRRFSPKNKNGSLNMRPLSPRSQQPRTPLPISAACGGEASDVIPVKPNKASVSFGATNTIHHFEQHEEDLYSDQDESVLSQEQKTIGSDVEDAIRDIFMINALGSCNPSPRRQRRIRYHSERRDEHREVDHSDTSDVEEDEDDDEDTLQSEEEHQTTRRRSKSNSGGKNRSKKGVEKEAKKSPQSEDAFYETMMSMMEGGIGAMTAVLGFASSADAAEEGGDVIAPAPIATTEEEIPADYTVPFPSSESPKRSSPSNGATRSSPAKASSPRALPTLPQKEKGRSLDRQENVNGVLDTMSDFVLGMDKSKSESYDELEPPRLNRPAGNETQPRLGPAPEAELDYEDNFQIVAQADEEDEPQSLEEDPRILELAKQAALCMHEVQGAKYDESRDVEIADIQFSVVELALPLGIIFQEDYSGCWVTKVMPKGNAHLSGTVAPGDQLAAINGKSAIGMKVDDICEAITDPGSQAESIGLTFLRYTGPFLPLPADVHIELADTEAVYEDEDSIYTYPPEGESVMVRDETPRSTISIADGKNSKVSSQKTEQMPSAPKRGRMKFKKWFKLGKKNASKAE